MNHGVRAARLYASVKPVDLPSNLQVKPNRLACGTTGRLVAATGAMFHTNKTEAPTDWLDVQESRTQAHSQSADEVPPGPNKWDGAGRDVRSEKDYFPSGITFKESSRTAVRLLAENHNLKAVALLRRVDETFVSAYATGRFKSVRLRIPVDAQDARLLAAWRQNQSLIVHDDSAESDGEAAAMLFPLVVGDEIKGALLVGDAPLDETTHRALSDYAREIALPLEMVSLREELEQRARVASHLQTLTERINSVGPEGAYATILHHSAELLHAERVSLLMFDETSNQLAMKAAVGPHAEAMREVRVGLDDGVAGRVLRGGRPLVVSDMEMDGHQLASPERRYKTNSFISYPLSARGRHIGILNVTDKLSGGAYDEFDLRLLEMFVPQITLALELAEWHQKAAEYQLLAITDPITGLLNRRYLEERIGEEIDRSKRHKYAMSFIMIDIDDFKLYNDRNGHQAGDVALELTAQCLKTALRSEDTAVRYGGEEFSVLLPQTGLDEARVIAERIRLCVEQTLYPHGKTQPTGAVTISVGLSTLNEALDTPASIISAADHALYQAKSHGKNCIAVHTTPAPPPS